MRGKPEMKVEDEIGHVTKPGANLFVDLGFPPAEARRLHTASREQINDALRLKKQLMTELADWIEDITCGRRMPPKS
jgi:hypothetical protein